MVENTEVNNDDKKEIHSDDKKEVNNDDNKQPNDFEEVWRKRNLERQEYMQKLKQWLDDARLWHLNICAGIPYNQFRNETTPQYAIQRNYLPNLPPFNLLNEQMRNRFPTFNQNNFSNRSVPPVFHFQRNVHQPPNTYEFVIPPLWKRAVAELMDFLLLFLLKMALTFLLLESFDIVDMGFYGFETFQKNLENSEVAVPMAIELLTLEVLHRLIVCAYETYFSKGKFYATPGKRYMGLMVVTAESITPGRTPDVVLATRAAPLNWQKSLMRAALKNLSVGLFLPICVAFYIFPHNRTSYDMMSNSIVIEYHQEFMLYHSTV